MMIRTIRSSWNVLAIALTLSCSVLDGPVFGQDSYELRRAQQKRFRSVAATLRPSLVRIETVGGVQPLGSGTTATLPISPEEGRGDAPPRSQTPFRDAVGSRFKIADGPTTGVVYSQDGYILTSSFHFVVEPAIITATLSDGRRFVAELVARDQVRKLAMLKIDATGLTVPKWQERQEIRVGQWAIALGLGFGGKDASVTVGVVSAYNRMMGNAIQTDAKLNPANYGGPLCDIDGRVLGICVPMAQRPGELSGVEFYDSGVGFAVPKDRVDVIAARLLKGESFYRGWLGVVLDPNVRDAAVILNIADPSPMLDAGIVPGDRIVKAAGKEIRHFGHLVKTLYMIPAGDYVRLELERDGAMFGAEVKLARNTELGPLPNLAEPFDPTEPLPDVEEELDKQP
jgi:serine protease Do